MDYLWPIASVLGGAFLLIIGGDILVRHAVNLAVRFRVPKTIVGAVILGFGTSMPELLVSLTAAVDGSPGIAIGNVVGSNIANVGLILGLGAFMISLRVQRRVLRVDLPIGVLAALLLLLWVGPQLMVTRTTGIVLLTGFVGYLWISLRQTRRFRAQRPAPNEPQETAQRTAAMDILLAVLGLVLITFGAHVLVGGAESIARLSDVSERVIGLSMVALSTSLPELAAVFAAARRNEADLAVGNIAGSNLFNILFVLGVTSVVSPVPVEPIMHTRDFPVLALFAVLAFPLLSRSRRIGRVQGGVLLAAYCVYMGITWAA